MGNTTELTFSQLVEAAPTAVYYALTNGAALREWLCTNSQVSTRVGGRLFLYWQQGYYACGEFKELVPGEKVVYQWQGRSETAVSTVAITLKPEGERTKVNLTHSGLPAGEDAAEMRQGIKEGWEAGLANLKAVLETGLDKRVYDQAFLGILISGQISAEQAVEMGIDAEGGITISGTMAETGAAAAGLQNNDIIVDMGGSQTKDFRSLQAAIRPYRAGDKVKVTYFRDGTREQTVLELSSRPVPTIPESPSDLAEAVKELYAELTQELNEVLAGVTEAEANYRADDEGWNAKEILAHLITTERGTQMGAATRITDGVLDGFPNNPPAWVRSVTAVYPTLADMVALWERTNAESVALLANLPQALVERKATYFGIGNTYLNGLPPHTRAHFAEIQGVIAAARES